MSAPLYPETVLQYHGTTRILGLCVARTWLVPLMMLFNGQPGIDRARPRLKTSRDGLIETHFGRSERTVRVDCSAPVGGTPIPARVIFGHITRRQGTLS